MSFGESRVRKTRNNNILGFCVLRNVLWVEAKDIYLTFLASAVESGARLPLDPEEPEG